MSRYYMGTSTVPAYCQTKIYYKSTYKLNEKTRVNF